MKSQILFFTFLIALFALFEVGQVFANEAAEVELRAVRRKRGVDDSGGTMVAQQRMDADGNPLFVGLTAEKLRRRRDLCGQACVCTRKKRDIGVDEGEIRAKRDDACQTECVCCNCGK